MTILSPLSLLEDALSESARDQSARIDALQVFVKTGELTPGLLKPLGYTFDQFKSLYNRNDTEQLLDKLRRYHQAELDALQAGTDFDAKAQISRIMGESTQTPIDKLEEAIGSLKGRTTDMRQQDNPMLGAESSPFADLNPGKWLVEFPVDEYPSAMAFMGPVAMAVVGHEDMDEEEFHVFFRAMHSYVYPRQTSEPVIAVTPGSNTGIDMRRMIRGGDYEQSLRSMHPASLQAFTLLTTLADDLNNHPLAQRSLVSMRGLRKFTVSELVTRLKNLAVELEEPAFNKNTMGDVLNNIAYPFGTSGIN